MVAASGEVVGHKVGLSSEAMQKMMNVDELDYGHLLDDMEVFEDKPVAAGRFLHLATLILGPPPDRPRTARPAR